MPLLLLLLLACGASSDLQLQPDLGDDTGAGGGGPDAIGRHCLLDPAPAESAVALRVDDAGVLWHLGVSGLLHRYERDDDCVFYGQVVAGVEAFSEVTDLDIDPDGNAWALVYFGQLERLDPAGNTLLSCKVPGAHVVAPAAGRVLTWPIGATELSVIDVSGDQCGASSTLSLDVALGTPAALAGGRLGAASHDPTGTLPPGYLLDSTTGAVTSHLPPDDAFDGEALRVVSDVAHDGEAWWVADGVDGNVWSLDGDGALRGAWSTHGTLPHAGADEDTWYSPEAIAARAGQPLYLAAGDVDYHGVWELAL